MRSLHANPAGGPLLGLGLGAAVLTGLAVTNPDRAAFQDFAADRLTTLLTRELCGNDGLPMLMRLVIRDCPALVASQHATLGRLALEHSRRRNFGLLSLYGTEIGGQTLFGGWRLPRYSATTLAIAGRFLILHTDEEISGELRR